MAAVQAVPATAGSWFRIGERDVDGIRVLSAYGALDLAAAAAFCGSMDAMRFGRRRLLLDLTPLEFRDSSGLRAVIGAVEEVVASGGRVAVFPPEDGAVARLFAVAGASEFMPLYASTDEGLSALGR